MALVCAYLEKFGDAPDKATEMIINASLERAHAGESFRWEESGKNWRVLRWEGQNS